MNDFAFVAIILAFFALAALFVTACDRIIGTDEEAFAGSSAAEPAGPAGPAGPDQEPVAA
jgi:hypothetical protein